MSNPNSGGLVRHSLLLMAATQVANVSNLAFQMVMGRTLSVVEYGVLSSMLGLVLVVATPMEAIRTAVAHYAARFLAAGRGGEVRPLVRSWLRDLSWVSLPLALAGIAFSGPLRDFFRLDSRTPIIITSIVLGGCPYMPVFSGAFQGVQSFLWMAASQHSWSVVRLATGTAFVLLIARSANWALMGLTFGIATSVLMGVIGAYRVLPAGDRGARPAIGAGRYFFFSLLTLVGFGVLMNADIIMVKHYFDAEEAGRFARAATIGRAIIFLPMPIALAMFPKVASAGDMSRRNRLTLLAALALAGGLIAAAVLAVSLLPHLALLVLFNEKQATPDMLRLVRIVIWAMSPLALTYVLMNFELAQHRFRSALWLAACAAGYVAGVGVWHDTPSDVARILGVSGLCAVAILVAGLPWRGGEPADESSARDIAVGGT